MRAEHLVCRFRRSGPPPSLRSAVRPLEHAMSLETAIETLRERNEPVPRPFRLPTEMEVAAAERTLGVTFPDDYRYFLLHGSDVAYGTLEPAVVIPDCGHLDLVEMVQTAWEVGVPRDHLPFCENNGDYYCLT